MIKTFSQILADLPVWNIPMKLAGPSGTYEITPFRTALRLVPTFPADFLPLDEPDESGEYRLPKAIQLKGGSFGPARIDQIQKETEEILEHYRRRVRRGERKALAELLDKNPAFILVPWVAETYLRFKLHGASMRHRGDLSDLTAIRL
jgi:hypothetical protein